MRDSTANSGSAACHCLAIWMRGYTRYDDVSSALKDDRLAKDQFNGLTPKQGKIRPSSNLLPATCRTLARPTTLACAAWFQDRSRRAYGSCHR